MKNKKGFKLFNFITKIISWCIMSVLCVIATFLIVYIIINKIAQSQGKNAPLGLYTIISASMTPEIDVYDVVFVVQKDPEEIQVGDIISYYSSKSYFGDTPITHRVVEKFNTNNGISFRTRGDANPVVDNEIIMEDSVIGTVRMVIPALGRIQFFLASKSGWFIAILVPALGIIIYDLIKLIKLINVKKKMKYVKTITEEDRPIKTRLEYQNEKRKKDFNESYEKRYDDSYEKKYDEPYEKKYDDDYFHPELPTDNKSKKISRRK